MIIPSNTSNQIKIQDVDEDEAWFDVIDDVTVLTTRGSSGRWGTVVALTAEDQLAIVRHLIAHGAVKLEDLS